MPSETPLRRNRDLVLVVGGGFVNEVGDWLLEIALPVYVYLETGSGLATAAVYVINLVIGVLLGPIGGGLVDRWPLRRTLVATNVVQAVALLPLLAVGDDRIWPVYLVTALQGIVQQVNDPASFSLLPRLVPPGQLVAANAVMSSSWSVARLVGAPLGGIAVAVGGLEAVLLADALTFLVAAAATSLVSDRANVIGTGDQPGGSEGEEADRTIRAGLREIRRRPPVAALVGVEALARLAVSAFPVIFIVFIADELGGGGTEVGVIRGMAAFGGLVAAALVTRVGGRAHPAAVMVAGFLAFGVVGFGFVNAPTVTTALWVYLVLFGLSGFPNATAQIGLRSTAQVLCPPRVLGRLSGLMSASGALGAGIGAIGAGLLLEVVSARALFNVQVACFALCGVIAYALVLRPLRASAEPIGAGDHPIGVASR
jgi:predicted MFS family arabinose efflux permease